MPAPVLRGIVLRKVESDGVQHNTVWELVLHFEAKPPNDKLAFRSLNIVDMFDGARSYCEQELNRERRALGLEPDQLELEDPQ